MVRILHCRAKYKVHTLVVMTAVSTEEGLGTIYAWSYDQVWSVVRVNTSLRVPPSRGVERVNMPLRVPPPPVEWRGLMCVISRSPSVLIPKRVPIITTSRACAVPFTSSHLCPPEGKCVLVCSASCLWGGANYGSSLLSVVGGGAS